MPDMGDRLEGLRTAIYEAVAETSDEMFEKYFSGEAFNPEEVIANVRRFAAPSALCSAATRLIRSVLTSC